MLSNHLNFPLKNLLSHYINHFLLLLLVLNLIIKYKKKKYDVFIVKDDDNYYWLLKPYNQSYYKTYVDFDNSNIDIVFFAIRKNEDLYS